MWIGLLAILGCYGVSIALIHLCFGNKAKAAGKAIQVLLITKDNQLQIEWYIRSVSLFFWIRGRQLQITILDEGSTDETLKIADRLSDIHFLGINKHTSEKLMDDFLQNHEDDQVIVAHIASQQELIKIPLYIQ
jgi:hypothetical protein